MGMFRNANASFVENRPFPSSPGPLFENEGRCSACDTEIIFHSHANETPFRKKDCAPSLILKARFLELRSGLLQGCTENWGKTCSLKKSRNAVQHNSDPVLRAASKWPTHKEIYKKIQFYCIKCFVLLQEIRGVFGQ